MAKASQFGLMIQVTTVLVLMSFQGHATFNEMLIDFIQLEVLVSRNLYFDFYFIISKLGISVGYQNICPHFQAVMISLHDMVVLVRLYSGLARG